MRCRVCGRCKGKVCKGARSGPRTRSAHSVPSRSDVLELGYLRDQVATVPIRIRDSFVTRLQFLMRIISSKNGSKRMLSATLRSSFPCSLHSRLNTVRLVIPFIDVMR
jgi:hypothetical protein